MDPEEPSKLESDSAVVYLKYDIETPPSPPPNGWTRFICISDTHSYTFPVPAGDVLLHSGDLTETGTLKGFQTTMEWISSLPHPVKILIAGNHDLTLHKDWYNTQWSRWHAFQQEIEPIQGYLTGDQAKEAGIVYLENQSYEFEAKPGGRKWTVYGSPWTPDFYNWAFNYNRGVDAEALISNFPKTDILLTHGPPYKILDKTTQGIDAGCETLAARLPKLRPRIHVFGHIHEGHGAIIKNWATNDEKSVLVNAANWPMGSKANFDGGSSLTSNFGAGSFQPVIVDLKD